MATQDIVSLPYQITEFNQDMVVSINKNFKEIERMLSILQLYMKNTGKPADQLTTGTINPNGTIDTSKLTDTLVGLTHDLQIAAEAVQEAHIALNAINTTSIKDNAITTPKILAGQITTDKIYAGSITTDHLSADGVSANKITSGELLTALVTIAGQNNWTKLIGDGLRIYNKNGALQGHFGYYQTLAAQLATFTRASTAYDSYGTSYASGVTRYPYARIPGPVWQDLFDADQLTEYTSGGDVAGTPTVSGGLLSYAGGTHATLTKNNLLLQNCDIVINSDQAQSAGIIARYQDNNNYYLLYLSDDSGESPTQNLMLYKRVGGTYTNLAIANVTWARGTSKPIKFTLHGSRLEAYFDGAKVISKIDTAFTGGSVGLRNNNATASRYLDFKVYYASQAAEIEEATTNLLTANQASVETDTTGFTTLGTNTLARSSTQKWHGSYSLEVTYQDDLRLWYIPYTVGSAGSYTFTAYVFLPSDWDGGSISIQDDGSFVGATIVTQTSTTTKGVWVRIQFTITIVAGDLAGLFLCRASSAPTAGRKVYFDGLHLEKLPYPTSWQLPGSARVAEQLTIPTAGVFNKGNWKIEFDYTPVCKQDNGSSSLLWVCVIDASNYYYLWKYSDGRPYLMVHSGGVNYQIYSASAPVMQIGSTYRITARGNGSQIAFFVNATKYGEVSYVEPVGSLPANMYLGNYSSAIPNGIYSSLRFKNAAGTDAEVTTDYATGLPLTVDEYTTCLMSMDGNLQPTVRGFGLWAKNGRFILQDPVAGQGFEVWDGVVRKVLIGRLDDSSIGQEIVGGKLYSSYIRSGGKTDTDYIELGAGFQPFTVKKDGKDALTIFSASDGGYLQILNPAIDDLCGQILPSEAFYGANGLKVQARSWSAAKNLALVGATIYLDPDYEVNILGNLHVGGDFSVSGSGKGCIVETIDYGKRWQYAVESPEIRLEDKGCGVLVDGQCRIELNPKFLQTIEKDLPEAPWVIDATPYFKGSLGVTEIGENYFVVNDCDDIPSNGRFSWSLSGVKIGCIGIYMPEFQPEGDILTSNWEDVLPTIDLLTIDTEVLTSNWEDELWKSTT